MSSNDTVGSDASREPTEFALHPSEWAQKLLGYSPEQRSAFWQFVHSNAVPFIRLGPRKIQFRESDVRSWLENRSTAKTASAA